MHVCAHEISDIEVHIPAESEYISRGCMNTVCIVRECVSVCVCVCVWSIITFFRSDSVTVQKGKVSGECLDGP